MTYPNHLRWERMKQRQEAFTLIEELIVIAMSSILLGAVFTAFLFCVRLEKAISAQQLATETFAEIDHAWRTDIHGAQRVSFLPLDAEDTASTAVVIEYPREAKRQALRYRLFSVDKERLALVRELLDESGTSRTQTLTSQLRAAEFFFDDEKRLYELRIATKAGFHAFQSLQMLRILASTKTMPIQIVPTEVSR